MGDSFLDGEGTPLGLHLLLWEGAKIFIEMEALQSCLFSLGKTLICVVKGLKRGNCNMFCKIYKKKILTLQENALLHR